MQKITSRTSSRSDRYHVPSHTRRVGRAAVLLAALGAEGRTGASEPGCKHTSKCCAMTGGTSRYFCQAPATCAYPQRKNQQKPPCPVVFFLHPTHEPRDLREAHTLGSPEGRPRCRWPLLPRSTTRCEARKTMRIPSSEGMKEGGGRTGGTRPNHCGLGPRMKALNYGVRTGSHVSRAASSGPSPRAPPNGTSFSSGCFVKRSLTTYALGTVQYGPQWQDYVDTLTSGHAPAPVFPASASLSCSLAVLLLET